MLSCVPSGADFQGLSCVPCGANIQGLSCVPTAVGVLVCQFNSQVRVRYCGRPKKACMNCLEVTRNGNSDSLGACSLRVSCTSCAGVAVNEAQGMGFSILVDRSSGRQTDGEEMGGDVVGR
jgi:hypothetical protein